MCLCVFVCLCVYVCVCVCARLIINIILVNNNGYNNTFNNNSNTFIQHGPPGPDGVSVLDSVTEAPDSGPVTV